MNDLESLYISISDDFELLKFPSYGILKRKINSNKDENNRLKLEKNSIEGTVELINKEAVKVLEFCDGKRKLKEIAEMFSYGDHVRREKIKQFLIQAVNKGHLVLKEKKTNYICI